MERWRDIQRRINVDGKSKHRTPCPTDVQFHLLCYGKRNGTKKSTFFTGSQEGRVKQSGSRFIRFNIYIEPYGIVQFTVGDIRQYENKNTYAKRRGYLRHVLKLN